MTPAMPICFMLFMQEVCLAFDFALERAGKSMAARMAMIAMTTSSSIKVKPVTILVPEGVSEWCAFGSAKHVCICVCKNV